MLRICRLSGAPAMHLVAQRGPLCGDPRPAALLEVGANELTDQMLAHYYCPACGSLAAFMDARAHLPQAPLRHDASQRRALERLTSVLLAARIGPVTLVHIHGPDPHIEIEYHLLDDVLRFTLSPKEE